MPPLPARIVDTTGAVVVADGDKQIYRHNGYDAASNTITGVVLRASFAYYSIPKSAKDPQGRPAWTVEMSSLWGPFLSKEVPLIVSYEKRIFSRG